MPVLVHDGPLRFHTASHSKLDATRGSRIPGVKQIALLAALLLAGCASAAPDIVRPEIQLAQLFAPSDLETARGRDTMYAEFGFRITNQASDAITLTRVALESSGEGGYYLRREDRAFDRQIGAGEAIEDTLQARAYFRTTGSGEASREPVTIRATFYFDSAKGSFRQTVLRNIGQFR
jgi:hypothetical protein